MAFKKFPYDSFIVSLMMLMSIQNFLMRWKFFGDPAKISGDPLLRIIDLDYKLIFVQYIHNGKLNTLQRH